MREAARALDDVSDHLGEVLRRADELLAEWSRFGAQVRAQVEREVATVGDVVDGAVARAAGSGIDRAVADRLRALTAELERLEQRTRAASRAVVEHREADRRVLWIVVAGVVLANALLVVLLLRKPDAVPVAEPIRIETPTAAPAPTEAAGVTPAAGSADGTAPIAPAAGSNAPSPASAGIPTAGGATAGANPAGASKPGVGSAGANTAGASKADANNAEASRAGANPAGAHPSGASTADANNAEATRAGASPAAANPAGASKADANSAGARSAVAPAKATPPHNAKAPADAGRPTLSPIALPPKGNARPHKKQP